MMTSGRSARRLLLPRRVQGPGILVADAFSRTAANLGVADTGQPWTERQGTWAADGASAYVSATAGDHQNVAEVDAGVADIVLRTAIAPFGGDAGVVFRLQDNANYWVLVLGPVDMRLYKRVSGAFSLIASHASGYSAGEEVKVVLAGSTIDCYRAGVLRISISDATHLAATRHGIRRYDAVDTTSRFGWFEVTG